MMTLKSDMMKYNDISICAHMGKEPKRRSRVLLCKNHSGTKLGNNSGEMKRISV